jgi:proline dehydrogenase
VPYNELYDDIFIYKYDFIKDILEFILSLEKGNKLRSSIEGLLFGYGLAEINEFMEKNYNKENEKNGR